MTVSQHLLELRNRLGKILIPLIGIFFLLFFISEFIIDGIINFVGISDIIVTLTPFEYMSTKLNFSVAAALTIIIPYLLFQLYQFCKPIINYNIQKE